MVAVHRGGRRVEKKIGDITLRPGDTLLLQVRPHFRPAHRHDPAFSLVSEMDDWRPLRQHRAWVALALFIILITLMSTGFVKIEVAAIIIAILMIACGCILGSMITEVITNNAAAVLMFPFSDFVRVGAPLNFGLWLVAVALIPLFWSF